MRLYYITLRDKYFGKYVTIYARSKDSAFYMAIKELGVLNVANVYTAKSWKSLYKPFFEFLKQLQSYEYDDYLKRNKIAFGSKKL